MKLAFREFSGVHDWGWCCEQVPILRVEDTAGIMAIDEDTDTTVGACIMDNWTANSVQTHFMITSPMVLKHGFIQIMFDFVFNHHGKKYMYGLVPGNNEKALKLNAHMGFTEKCRMPEAFAENVDYVLMELTKQNCKYLPGVVA